MKLLGYLFFLLLLIIGCQDRQYAKEKIIQDNIEGNWKTEQIDLLWGKAALPFTFRDSSCSYISPWGNYSNYWITGDTLNIKEKVNIEDELKYGGQLVFQFFVDSISQDKLCLTPITKQTKMLFTYFPPYDTSSIQLTKIDSPFDWKVERICLYSTGCFGSCPSMYLEIDSLGNIFFQGKNHTTKKGFYSGNISRQAYLGILHDINSIDFHHLENYYLAPWTDDQTCGLLISSADTTYETHVYGYNEEPLELRLLIHRLMEIYKVANLEEDPKTKDQFKMERFRLNIFPPPPPPPQIELVN